MRAHLDLDVGFVSRVSDGKRVFVYVDADDAGCPVQVGGSDPVEDSYCHYVIGGQMPQLLRDPSQHPVAAGMPATRDLPVGTHISVPIVLADGSVFGTFCCFSHDVVDLDERDLAAVRMLSRVVTGYIEEEEAARRAADQRRQRIEHLTRGSGLTTVFQPIVTLSDPQTVGYEALARFPELGEAPDTVFADAWRLGIGPQLEMDAIRAALDGFPQLPDDGYLAVNAAPLTLTSPDFYAVIDAADVNLARLVVEVTEHAAVDDYQALLEVVGRLAERGVRLAIDDVGTGISGLSHIVRLSPQIIKIDRALVKDIDNSLAKQAMLAALVTFAGRTGVTTLAEGIETAAEWEALRVLGVNLGQGYYFGHPQPLSDILTCQVA